MEGLLEKEFNNGMHLIVSYSYTSMTYGIEDLEIDKAMLWGPTDEQLNVSDHFTRDALEEFVTEHIMERRKDSDEDHI